MKDLVIRSEELFGLYEGVSGVLDLDEERVVEERRVKSLEAIYGASQWQLIWRKFVRNRVAVAGGVVILLFYLLAILAGFVAPYTETTRFTQHIYMQPQVVHLFNDGKLQPFKSYLPKAQKAIR